jgi:hypothetical protein
LDTADPTRTGDTSPTLGRTRQIDGISDQELATRFTYHAPTEDQRITYEVLRQGARDLARLIRDVTPSSREQSLAMTSLEETVFWANAAIARRST